MQGRIFLSIAQNVSEQLRPDIHYCQILFRFCHCTYLQAYLKQNANGLRSANDVRRFYIRKNCIDDVQTIFNIR